MRAVRTSGKEVPVGCKLYNLFILWWKLVVCGFLEVSGLGKLIDRERLCCREAYLLGCRPLIRKWR